MVDIKKANWPHQIVELNLLTDPDQGNIGVIAGTFTIPVFMYNDFSNIIEIAARLTKIINIVGANTDEQIVLELWNNFRLVDEAMCG